MGNRQPDASQRFDRARVLIASAPLLALGTFAVLEWAEWGTSRDRLAVGGEVELLVWKALITAQVAAWAVLAGVGLEALSELDAQARARFAESAEIRRPWRRETWGFVAFSYTLVAALFLLPILAGIKLRNPTLLTGQDWKINLVFGLAGAAILPLLIVLKRIQLTAAEKHSWAMSTTDIQRIRLLRRKLRTATASLGTIIALYLISSGALNKAVEASFEEGIPDREPVPDSIILVAGAWFTGILAAIYLYVFASVEGRAQTLVERAAPLPDPSPAAAEEFTATTNLRRELSAELELGGDTRRNLEGLIAVFSPLAAALLNRYAGL